MPTLLSSGAVNATTGDSAETTANASQAAGIEFTSDDTIRRRPPPHLLANRNSAAASTSANENRQRDAHAVRGY